MRCRATESSANLTSAAVKVVKKVMAQPDRGTQPARESPLGGFGFDVRQEQTCIFFFSSSTLQVKPKTSVGFWRGGLGPVPADLHSERPLNCTPLTTSHKTPRMDGWTDGQTDGWARLGWMISPEKRGPLLFRGRDAKWIL